MPPNPPFSSLPLFRPSQTEPESDSGNKSLVVPGSNQHSGRMAWESMWASSSLDNAFSGYQSWSVQSRNAAPRLWLSPLGMSWPHYTFTMSSVRVSIKSARSLRHQLHGFDLQRVVPALTQGWWIHQSMVHMVYHSRCQIKKMDGIFGLSHYSRWLFVQYKRWHTGLTMATWKDIWESWHISASDTFSLPAKF